MFRTATASRTDGRSLVLRHGFTAVAVAMLTLAMIMAPAKEAQAGKRGIAIGVGVVGGLIILNEISKNRGRKYGKGSGKSYGKNKYYNKSNKTQTAKARKGRKNSDSTENAEIEQGSTAGDDEVIAARAPSDDDSGPNSSSIAGEHVVTSATESAAAAAPPTQTGALGAEVGKVELISTSAEIKSAQEHLAFMGHDIPEANGVLDLKTKIAIMEFQDKLGSPATGQLTVEQLQTLYKRASAQVGTAAAQK